MYKTASTKQACALCASNRAIFEIAILDDTANSCNSFEWALRKRLRRRWWTDELVVPVPVAARIVAALPSLVQAGRFRLSLFGDGPSFNKADGKDGGHEGKEEANKAPVHLERSKEAWYLEAEEVAGRLKGIQGGCKWDEKLLHAS